MKNLSVDRRSNHALLLSVLAIVLGLLSLWLSSKFFGLPAAGTSSSVLYYLVPLVFLGIWYFFLPQPRAFTNFAQRLKDIFARGWYLWLAGLALAILFYLSAPEGSLSSPSAGQVVWFVLAVLLTGVFEELLCRGWVQTELITGGNSPWMAIVVSSGLFAVMHFANLIDRPWLVVGTFAQVAYTFCIGLFLGVIFYLGKDLLTVILLHAGFNFLGGIVALFGPPASEAAKTDVGLGGALIQLAILAPCALLAWRYYRVSERN